MTALFSVLSCNVVLFMKSDFSKDVIENISVISPNFRVQEKSGKEDFALENSHKGPENSYALSALSITSNLDLSMAPLIGFANS